MQRSSLLIMCTLFAGFLYGQKDSVIKTEVYLDSTPPLTTVDSIFYSRKNVLTISFMEGFNDSVFIFRNGKCFDSLYLVTNESLGFAGSTAMSYSNKEETIDLVVRFKSGATIKERLNLNFTHLQIRRLRQWDLYYSNHFPKLK